MNIDRRKKWVMGKNLWVNKGPAVGHEKECVSTNRDSAFGKNAGGRVVGERWSKDSVIARDRLAEGFPINPPHLTDMPAYCSSSFTTSASINEGRLHPHSSGPPFNHHGRLYQRGAGFEPYPQEQEVFLCSNTDMCDNESWHKLGLSNFVTTNIQIGRHQFSRYSHTMMECQRGLFNRGLEPWDPEEQYDTALEALLGYTASMGMMLYEGYELL